MGAEAEERRAREAELCEKRLRETAVGILDVREREPARARGARTAAAKSGEVKAIFSAERNPRKGERVCSLGGGGAREPNGDKPRAETENNRRVFLRKTKERGC